MCLAHSLTPPSPAAIGTTLHHAERHSEAMAQYDKTIEMVREMETKEADVVDLELAVICNKGACLCEFFCL